MTHQHRPVGIKTVELSSDTLNDVLAPAYKEVVRLRLIISSYANYREKTLNKVHEFKRSRTWIDALLDPNAKHHLEDALAVAAREDQVMHVYLTTLLSHSWEQTLEIASIPGSHMLEEKALLNIFNFKPENTRYHLDTISQARKAYERVQLLLESMTVERLVGMVDLIVGQR